MKHGEIGDPRLKQMIAICSAPQPRRKGSERESETQTERRRESSNLHLVVEKSQRSSLYFT
jgi:hypothetical protein